MTIVLLLLVPVFVPVLVPGSFIIVVVLFLVGGFAVFVPLLILLGTCVVFPVVVLDDLDGVNTVLVHVAVFKSDKNFSIKIDRSSERKE